MSRAMPAVRIVPVSRLELGYAPYRWEFAEARRAEIDAHFALLRAVAPGMWNGRMLMMREPALDGDTLRGVYFEAGYADFSAWRDWDFPDRTVVNCFSMGALRTADGAYLMGVMGSHTATPGRIYFPAGTPDPTDRRGDAVDLLGNVIREVAEETGLTAQDFAVAPGWDAAFAGQRIALMKTLDVPHPAEALREAILRHLAREAKPELSDIRIVRSPRDFDPRMPPYVTAYLSQVWGAP